MTLSTLSIFSKICLILQTDFCLIVTLLLFLQSSGMQHPSRTCQRSELSRQPLALRPSSWITPSPIFFCSVRLARGLMTCHLSLQSADCEALLSPQHCWGAGRLRRGRRAGEESLSILLLLLAPKPSLRGQPGRGCSREGRQPPGRVCGLFEGMLPCRGGDKVRGYLGGRRLWTCGSRMLFDHTCWSFPSLARESQAMWPCIWLPGKDRAASGPAPAQSISSWK